MRGQLLGKHFRYHGKMPLGINVFNKDFKERILSLCSSTYGRMAGSGPLFSMQFTTVSQSVDHGIENLKTICQTIGKEFPGSWLNIDHAYLYGNNLQSLPIYYSTHTKNDVKKLNLPINSTNELTQIGELSTAESNVNVIVQPNGNVQITKRKTLSTKPKKKKPTKRLQKTWLKGIQVQPSIKTKPKKEKKPKKVEEEPVFNTENKPLVETEFVKRIASTKLAKKNEKPKHIEQNFASKPAPRADKRKRLLAAAKEASKANGNDEQVPTLIDDSEERKIKSGGRSKKKVRLDV